MRWFTLLLALAVPVHAQVVRGRVLAPDSATAMAGVVVQLVDSTGHVTARVLSRGDGTFFLAAATPGSYALRAVRVGFQPLDVGPFRLEPPGRTDFVLLMRALPVSIAAITVTGRNECVRFNGSDAGGGGAALAIWEEARKSLLASVVARGEGTFDVTTTVFERVTSPTTGHVLRQSVRERSGLSGRPFFSPLDPEAYATQGYRELAPDGATWRAPDADVLLSDGFAARHCLRLAESPAGDEAGVVFEPLPSAPGTRDDGAPLVDVTGTLWVDRHTAALRRADFRYTNVGHELADAGAGGTLQFTWLPGDVPVVSAWQITVPRLERSAPTPRAPLRVTELWSFGGALAEARRGGAAVWRAPLARVQGSAYAGRPGAPAPRARVALAGTSYAAIAGADGAWVIDQVLPGRYEVLVQSETGSRLELPPRRAGTIDATTTSAVTLALDAGTPDDAVHSRCGDTDGERGALLVELAEPLRAPRPYVAALWDAVVAAPGAVGSVKNDGAMARPDSLGRVHFCGVPRGRALDVVVASDSALRDRLGRAPAKVAEDSTFTTVAVAPRPRTVRLAGRVVDETGAPVADADAEVVGGATRRSDGQGRFTLDAPAEEGVLLRVRRIGYQTAVQAVKDPSAPLVITLAHAATTIAGVTVRADSSPARRLDVTGFEARRRTGQGSYLGAPEIAQRRATRVEHLLAMVPGIVVDTAGVARPDRGRTSILADNCAEGVQLFIDGVAVSSSYSLRSISPESIRGIEVYRGAASTPPELRSARSACGTVAIWTK